MIESAGEFIIRKKREFPGKRVISTDIGRERKLSWRREQVTMRVQSNYPQKVFLIERLRLEEVRGPRLREGGAQIGDVEYRLAYYTVSRTDKWWWGQFATFIPQDDFCPLIEQAQEEETILL